MACWTLDVRFTLRGLVRRPAFAAAVVLTVAAGVGSATSVYSVVDGVLLRPLAYARSDRLVTVWQTFPHWRDQPVLGTYWERIALSWESYRELRERQSSFEMLGAYYGRPTVVGGLGDAEEMVAAAGSASLLELLGERVVRGRWFAAGEEGGDAPRVAVLSHELWRTRLGGSEDVLGRTVHLEGEPFTVVGVLRRGFTLRSLHPTADGRTPAVWRPIGSMPGDLTRASNNYEVLARLHADVSVQRAAAEVEPILRGERSPDQRGARVLPRLHAETNHTRAPLLLLSCAVGLLLVLACANVAALLLGEATSRVGEMSTRAALGASRIRIARQLLTESLVLAGMGGALGVLVALAGTRWLLALAPAGLPRVEEVGVSLRVLAFCLATTVLTGVLFGLAPAWKLSDRAASARLGGTRSTVRKGRLQAGLIAAQLALCVVLVFSAGLLGRSLSHQSRMGLGLDTERLVVVRARLAPAMSDARATYTAIATRLRGAVGASGVTMAAHVPLGGTSTSQSISLDPDAGLTMASPSAQRDAVLPGYFELLGIPLLEGRTLQATDGPDGELVVVVNEAMARRFWPGESALGKPLRSPAGVATVVGVTGDVRHHGLERPSDATFYLSLLQAPSSRFSVLVRTRGDARAFAGRVRDEIRSAAGGLPILDVETMEGLVSRSLIDERYRALLVGMFSGLATLLAAVGIAGVAARAIAQQMRELCIRVAVGATPARVLARVLVRGLTPVVIGLGLGSVAALAAARLLRGYLFEVRSSDPAALAASMLLLLFVMTATLLVQSRRVLRSDLGGILRAD